MRVGNVTGLVWSLGLGAWRLSENWPWLRCRVWTWFRGSAAVGVQKDLSLLATFPCRTADLGGSLALDPSVQEGLAAPWLFRRLVGTKLRRGSKSGELQGGLVVQNLPDPLAWPGRHPSWRGKASAHTSWLLGSPPAAQTPSRRLSGRPGWSGALSVCPCGLAGGPRGAPGRGPACRALCRSVPGVREAQSIQIDTICFPIRCFSVEF